MYNSEIPTRAELPTTAQLIKSTIIAIITAATLLITVVLPAEYAIDPTGVGKILQLTEMGEIKTQLAEEAEADRVLEQNKQKRPSADQSSSLVQILASLLVSPAAANDRIVIAQGTAPTTGGTATGGREDEFVIVLKPRQGAEYKLEMKKGAKADYSWSVDGGVANYDLHGTQPGGKESSYKKGRGVSGDKGVLTASYDGIHGWFWRNRGKANVTITLLTKGMYTNPKRVK
ncbi:MAG: hypothetical protein ACI9XZ_004088 [Alphaproteobacteria bacterium]|jgi:hypothetical protein